MFLAFLLNGTLVALTVGIHYEFLYRLSRYLPKIPIKHRFKIVLGVMGSLFAHVVEIWVFAFAFYFMHHAPGWGRLEGSYDASLMDTVYFSFTTYTTVGFGDIQPVGQLRYLTGIESLVGLVLITWSASFLYLEMQKFWDSR